jgi:hypothetical protein
MEWISCLDNLANSKKLSDEEAKVLFAKFSKPRAIETNAKTATSTGYVEKTIEKHLEKIYIKFGIVGTVRGKQDDLRDLLLDFFVQANQIPDRPSSLSLDSLWQQLLDMAEYTRTKMGLISPHDSTKFRGFKKKSAKSNKYLPEVNIDDDILISIHPESLGYLVLFERDELGKVYCLVPSEWLTDNQVEKKEYIIPQDGESIKPELSGKIELLAIVVSDISKFTWLKDIQLDKVVEVQNLQQLLEHINLNNGTSELFYTSFLVRRVSS